MINVACGFLGLRINEAHESSAVLTNTLKTLNGEIVYESPRPLCRNLQAHKNKSMSNKLNAINERKNAPEHAHIVPEESE